MSCDAGPLRRRAHSHGYHSCTVYSERGYQAPTQGSAQSSAQGCNTRCSGVDGFATGTLSAAASCARASAHAGGALCPDARCPQRKAAFATTDVDSLLEFSGPIAGIPASATAMQHRAHTLARCASTRLRLFCVAEWCYSAIDRGYFLRNEFKECLSEMRVPAVRHRRSLVVLAWRTGSRHRLTAGALAMVPHPGRLGSCAVPSGRQFARSWAGRAACRQLSSMRSVASWSGTGRM